MSRGELLGHHHERDRHRRHHEDTRHHLTHDEMHGVQAECSQCAAHADAHDREKEEPAAPDAVGEGDDEERG